MWLCDTHGQLENNTAAENGNAIFVNMSDKIEILTANLCGFPLAWRSCSQATDATIDTATWRDSLKVFLSQELRQSVSKFRWYTFEVFITGSSTTEYPGQRDNDR